jgi:hypothetical protein
LEESNLQQFVFYYEGTRNPSDCGIFTDLYWFEENGVHKNGDGDGYGYDYADYYKITLLPPKKTPSLYAVKLRSGEVIQFTQCDYLDPEFIDSKADCWMEITLLTTPTTTRKISLSDVIRVTEISI